MANKKKLQGRASKQKKREGMPESHAHMTPAEHKKAMAKLKKE